VDFNPWWRNYLSGSKKQTCIIDPNLTTKFVALAYWSKEWLRNLLLEILIWTKPMPPISLHYDSQVTLSRAYSHIYNGKSRYIGVRHSHIRQLLIDEIITIDFVRFC
jgi:hypothetical protein